MDFRKNLVHFAEFSCLGRCNVETPVFTEPSESGAIQAEIDSARGGSPQALGKLLNSCRPYLLKIANEFFPADLQPKAGASDLVQQTFLEAHKDFAHFGGATEEEL